MNTTDKNNAKSRCDFKKIAFNITKITVALFLIFTARFIIITTYDALNITPFLHSPNPKTESL